MTARRGSGSPIGLGIFSPEEQAAVAPAVVRVPNVADNSTENYQVGDTVVTTNGSWVGNPAPSYAYQWQRCNSAGEDCVNISGATTPSYVLGGGDIGTRVRSVITAENTGGKGSSESTVSPLVVAQVIAAPSGTSLPMVTDTSSSNYYVGDTLSATHGGWSSTVPLTYSYQWERCSSFGLSCSPIAGATNSAYTLGISDNEAKLRVVVTATNSGGQSSASSMATFKVTTAPSSPSPPPTPLTPPVNLSQPLVLGTPGVGATLSANHGNWSSGSGLTYSYQWLDCRPGATPSSSNCSFVLVGGAESSYKVKESDVGNTLAVLVTATNASGNSISYSAATAVVTKTKLSQ